LTEIPNPKLIATILVNIVEWSFTSVLKYDQSLILMVKPFAFAG